MSNPELPIDPEAIKAKENKPEAGALNLIELINMLGDNLYRDEIMGHLKSKDFSFDDIKTTFRRRAGLTQRYIELAELADGFETVSAREMDQLYDKLVAEGLFDHGDEPDITELKAHQEEFEQVLRWVEGVGEIATQKIDLDPLEQQLARELAALRDAGNKFAGSALEYWSKEIKSGSAPDLVAERLLRDLDDYRKRSADQGDLGTVRLVHEVIKSIERWYS